MADTDDFHDLIARVRAGDRDAATELVRLYEPAIRRAARIRIVDPRLSPLLDSSDVAQSVFTSFFVRAALGQYDLDKPQQVLSLLVSMSRKKVADFARQQAAARRDYRRIRAGNLAKRQLHSADPDPCQQASMQELIQEFRNRLTPKESELANLRSLGKNWSEIAAEMGDSSEALRKKLHRAVNRISQDLGLDDFGDE